MIVCLLAVSACGSTSAEDDRRVSVFAAASLTDAFAELVAAFELAHPNYEVELNLGGSSSLREQVLAGAPADVFASANLSTMEALVEAEAVDSSVEVFARNSLALAVPAGNPGAVAALDDLRRESLLIGICSPGVPCGDLARQWLADAQVVPSIDTNEPDVRSLVTKLVADELDAGLVYATDIRAVAPLLELVETGESIPSEVRSTSYPIALVADAPNKPGGSAFVSFVVGDGGQRILARHGFSSPR